MDDDLFSPRRHDGRANRHLLDLNAVGEFEVVLGYLLREVQILLALNGSEAGVFNGFDAVQPLDALRKISDRINNAGGVIETYSCTDITQAHYTKRITMNPW